MNAPDPKLAYARIAIDEGRIRDAHAACLDLIERTPGNPEAFLLLGEIARTQDDPPNALRMFNKAHELDPDSPLPLIWLASTLLLFQDTASARAAAEHASTLQPKDADSLDTLGVIFGRTGDYHKSVAFFKRATDLEPQNAQYQFNLGCGYQIIGDFENAEHAYRLCIGLDPGAERAYIALAEMMPQNDEKSVIADLEIFFRMATSDVGRRLTIGHALAKSYEDTGDHKLAVDCLAKAKAPRREQAPYNVARDKEVFAAAALTFPGKMATGPSVQSDKPIFVVGMPRSGTTLTDRILSSHPDVVSIGEFLIFPTIVERMAGDAAQQFGGPGTFRRATVMNLEQLGADYLRAAEATARTSGHFVDKLPFNFLYAGLIHRALPNAKIVCLIREPIDTCLSNYRVLFGPRSAFHDYTYDLCDIARYYAMFAKLVSHWRTSLPADRFMQLDYEALVADQIGETRRLLAFCGLEWDQRCLSFHENNAGVWTPSLRQVRSPLFTTSIGRWRRYGDALAPMIAILREAGLVSHNAATALSESD